MAATLGDVGDVLGIPVGVDVRSIPISDAHHDSRQIAPGSLFVAVTGERSDGHAFIGQAVERGAAAVLAERAVPDPGVPVLGVGDTRIAMAPAARRIHGDPDDSLDIVGVTGTNGKTTVVHLCDAIWGSLDRPHGIIGTLGASYGGNPVDLARTTPESSDLQRLLAEMVRHGVRDVAMEVSSHALELHRADAIAFTAVGFTNLTQDHLDFHGTMDAYLAAKQKLFRRHRAEAAVINVGDPAGRATAKLTDLPVTTVAIDREADLRATEVRPTPDGTTFFVRAEGSQIEAHLPLIGTFNVENALVALGLVMANGVDLEDGVRGLARTQPIRGRMEVVPHGGRATVAVDYAHTPDAISAVLASVTGLGFRRRIVVVGAGGDRDTGKRHAMGRSAADADITIVTTDNPRSEDPLTIARAVQEGALAAARADVRVVLDREEAIATAIDAAGPGDLVLILGKGHEQGQDVDGTIHPFDDAAVARRLLHGAS